MLTCLACTHKGQPAVITDANCDEASIIGAPAELNRALLKTMFPLIRWLLSRLGCRQFSLQEIKFIKQGINGHRGGIGYAKELCFDIFVSNNVYNSATQPLRLQFAGSYNASLVDQLSVVEAMRGLEGYFADGCRGLYTYGTKVLKPKES